MTLPIEMVSILLTTAIGMSVTGIYQLLAIARKVENFQEWKVDHLKITETVVRRIEDISTRVLRIESWIAADERSTNRDMDMIREIKQEVECLRNALSGKTYAGD